MKGDDMRGRKSGPVTPKSESDAELNYARQKVASWLMRALDMRVAMDEEFFRCLFWVLGERKSVLQEELRALDAMKSSAAVPAVRAESMLKDVLRALDAMKNSAGVPAARAALRETLENGQMQHLSSECEELVRNHRCLEEVFSSRVRSACRNILAEEVDGSVYARASAGLERVFGIGEEARAICEFVFILQHFSPVENYFEDSLRVFHFCRRRLFAHMMGVSHARLHVVMEELEQFGILYAPYNGSFRIGDSVLVFWEAGEAEQDAFFHHPLEGEGLPIQDFCIPEADARHALNLLRRRSGEAVHILLYGASGTGKTSFALALARACGVKAWAVTSREDDDDSNRRASLTACLHLSAGHEGSFVVVDEAERMLDTNLIFGRQTKDKAWLNSVLERPGQRVIWISNEVEHIDPAVRRRFSFSIHFECLSRKDRVRVWRQVMKRHGLSRRCDQARITELAARYPVEAAVIQEAVSQAQSLYRYPQDFHAALERILQAQLKLQAGGNFRPAPFFPEEKEFMPECVCMEGDVTAFLERCRRVDAAMRRGKELRAGCGTMLFYGPPGTGKTALARYMADHLGRECLCRRASDLMNAFVGETEKSIAGAFREAEHSGAVLIIDEVDSFLFSRTMARHSWEGAMVNEFLTSLEQCRCFCICTTNRRDRLDAAAMRRFTLKVAFGYAGSAQEHTLYAGMLAPLCREALPEELGRKLLAMKRLTPGDFHAVRTRYDPLFTEPGSVSHKELIEALAREAALRTESSRHCVGFLR